jgi:hypothetical protein
MNTLDLAGVMALSSGLKANHVMRCLDLNIPPDDEEMARYVYTTTAQRLLQQNVTLQDVQGYSEHVHTKHRRGRAARAHVLRKR